MSETEFTTRRFRTAAQHYLAGRPAYADALIARMALLCGLGEQDRVLDLGCGPGQIARAFAPLVAEVVALDPEPEMLAIARAIPAPGRVVYHQASSDDLPGGFGRYRLVCMGRSFHWMDREETLRRLDGMVEPGGAVALLRDTHPELPSNAWWRRFREVIQRFSGDEGLTARKRAPGFAPQETVLMESAFCRLEQIGVFVRQAVGIETLVERALSMSSTSRARLGEGADQLAAELREALGKGPFDEVYVSEALIAFRP